MTLLTSSGHIDKMLIRFIYDLKLWGGPVKKRVSNKFSCCALSSLIIRIMVLKASSFKSLFLEGRSWPEKNHGELNNQVKYLTSLFIRILIHVLSTPYSKSSLSDVIIGLVLRSYSPKNKYLATVKVTVYRSFGIKT